MDAGSMAGPSDGDLSTQHNSTPHGDHSPPTEESTMNPADYFENPRPAPQPPTIQPPRNLTTLPLTEEILDLFKSMSRLDEEDNEQERDGGNKKIARWHARIVRADQLKHLQLYLGVRPCDSAALNAPGFVYHIQLPRPWEPIAAPIFFVFDTEWLELDHTKVLEVGIAMLDTLALGDGASGDNAIYWRQLISSKHLIIQDNQHLVNCRYVRGCPQQFEFGESESVKLSDIAEILRAILSPPYPAGKNYAGTPLMSPPEPRNLVIVGHNPKGDINALKLLGCDLFTLAPEEIGGSKILDVLDTAVLDREFRHSRVPRKLASILNAFEIDAYHLHNAGNDAHYTMAAMLAMAVEDRFVVAPQSHWSDS